MRRMRKFCWKFVCLFIILLIFLIWRGNDDDVEDGDVIVYAAPSRNDLLFTEEEFRKMTWEKLGGVTPDYNQLKNIKIIYDDVRVSKRFYLNVTEYEDMKSRQFIAAYSNPFKKEFPHERPKLRKYSENMQRPNPLMLIKNPMREINENEINEELMKMENYQISMGDDDITQIPEIVEIIKKYENAIPNIVHFIWFNCRRYKIHHYMSMMSSLQYQDPDLILLHTNCPPNGSFWDSFVRAADSKLKILRRSPPQEIWGRSVQKVEHQSDVARLQIMLQMGGIYIDDDVIVVRSLDQLRHHHHMILGEENFDALANSVIMANPNSWFLKRWFQEYQHFNDSVWSESSCFVPWSLWKLFPDDIHVVMEKMLRPNWEEISFLYRELFDWRDNFTIHLFSRFMKLVDGTDERSIIELAVLNTTYGEIARHVLWGDSKFHDVKEWILQIS